MKQLTPAINIADHVFGNPIAPFELVEYGDYECLNCGRAYSIVKEVQRQLGSDVKFVFRNFPLSKIHPHAFMSAVATEAAGRQRKFWKMHEIIFENQEILDAETILMFAENLGLDLESFKKDLQDDSLISKVENDFESGIRSGVNRTPCFFINGSRYDGQWGENHLLRYLKSRKRISEGVMIL